MDGQNRMQVGNTLLVGMNGMSCPIPFRLTSMLFTRESCREQAQALHVGQVIPSERVARGSRQNLAIYVVSTPSSIPKCHKARDEE
jgi:hypothetical protein